VYFRWGGRSSGKTQGIAAHYGLLLSGRETVQHTPEGIYQEPKVYSQPGYREIAGEYASLPAEDGQRFAHDAGVFFRIPGLVAQADLGELDVRVRWEVLPASCLLLF
jgi:hypothetical protein